MDLRPSAPSINTKPFGVTPEGEATTLFTLTNRNGLSVSITSYGAIITSILTPDREGNLEDIALGFPTLDGYFGKQYLTELPHFGATIGRYANRIGGASFVLDGRKYELDRNDGPDTTLHGGAKGFDSHVWRSEILAGEMGEKASVRFSFHSPDGDQGFPGAMDAAVTYTLTDGNELQMDYTAVSDKKTVVNFTNHTYFNLAGAGNGTILDHEVTILADAYTPANAAHVPTGEIRPVEGSPLDFRQPHTVGARINELLPKRGYGENYIIRQAAPHAFGLNAEVYEPQSGRILRIFSDQPGIQFYTAHGLSGKLIGKGGKPYRPLASLCLEPQNFPDAPNHPNFPSPVLNPGETYRARIVFQFGAR